MEFCDMVMEKSWNFFATISWQPLVNKLYSLVYAHEATQVVQKWSLIYHFRSVDECITSYLVLQVVHLILHLDRSVYYTLAKVHTSPPYGHFKMKIFLGAKHCKAN